LGRWGRGQRLSGFFFLVGTEDVLRVFHQRGFPDAERTVLLERRHAAHPALVIEVGKLHFIVSSTDKRSESVRTWFRCKLREKI
jgi:hypothetical protein